MRRRSSGLAARLFAAQTLIALVGAATLWLVAAEIGPGIFRTHLHEAAAHVDASTSRHVEEAYSSASGISIAFALLASLLAALAVSWYASRRIAGPVGLVADAAAHVAAGRYEAEVTDPGLGREFATLTASFNEMSGRLATVETTRRRLLTDLAHEMRTPVATLDAYLEGLEDGVVDVDADTLAMLRRQTGRLALLADDITAVSRAEEHQIELHLRREQPAKLVAAAVQAAADRFAAKQVTLTADAVTELSEMLADADRIGQVLANLLDNALRHTPAGGRVTVSAHAVEAGNAVEITVADTGEGITAEHLPHVFERFYRADRARDRQHGGSGIGLAIVRALVEAHGGTVTANSAGSGAGATFAVRLPLSPDSRSDGEERRGKAR